MDEIITFKDLIEKGAIIENSDYQDNECIAFEDLDKFTNVERNSNSDSTSLEELITNVDIAIKEVEEEIKYVDVDFKVLINNIDTAVTYNYISVSNIKISYDIKDKTKIDECDEIVMKESSATISNYFHVPEQTLVTINYDDAIINLYKENTGNTQPVEGEVFNSDGISLYKTTLTFSYSASTLFLTPQLTVIPKESEPPYPLLKGEVWLNINSGNVDLPYTLVMDITMKNVNTGQLIMVNPLNLYNDNNTTVKHRLTSDAKMGDTYEITINSVSVNGNRATFLFNNPNNKITITSPTENTITGSLNILKI